MPEHVPDDQLAKFRDRAGQPDDPLKDFRVTKEGDLLASFRGLKPAKKANFKPFDKGYSSGFGS